MKKLILATSMIFYTFSALAGVSELCKSQIYAKVDKQLPANQFVSKLASTSNSSIFDLEITLDQGEENYCLKAGQVQIEKQNEESCKIISVEIERGNSDCG